MPSRKTSRKTSGRGRADILLRLVLPVCLVGLLAAWWLVHSGGDRLVVYCAHDSIYSEKILADFEKKTGLAVSIVFDTEATKSLGLLEQIIREKDAPRCDVFWNNELLGTLDLAERGVLAPYKGPGYARIPDVYKDPEGRWTGFAARMRVFIVNTEKLSASEAALGAAVEKGDLSRTAIAKPLYGTTLTHYAVLWDHWGAEKLKRWHHDIRRRGIREVTGNATVKNLVATGVCDFGFTDTDDFFVAKDEGKPVRMFPVRVPGGNVISIPNTVCIINGTRRPDAARKLVDTLLSEETELALANSKSRQIPLGAVDQGRLSADVRELAVWARDGYPISSLGEARKTCLSWLKSEYLK